MGKLISISSISCLHVGKNSVSALCRTQVATWVNYVDQVQIFESRKVRSLRLRAKPAGQGRSLSHSLFARLIPAYGKGERHNQDIICTIIRAKWYYLTKPDETRHFVAFFDGGANSSRCERRVESVVVRVFLR